MSVTVSERVVKRVSFPTRMVEKRRVTDLKPGRKSAIFTGTLQDENIVLNVLDYFLLFVLGTVRVDIVLVKKSGLFFDISRPHFYRSRLFLSKKITGTELLLLASFFLLYKLRRLTQYSF